MNTYFLNAVKAPLLSLIKNGDADVFKAILFPNYSEDCLEYFDKLKQDLSVIQFATQFPAQATRFPAISFILGNIQAPLQMQSYSFINDELSDKEIEIHRKVARALGYKAANINVNACISQSQVLVGIYSNNKTEVSWLMLLVDYILKVHSQVFVQDGILDLAVSETDLRLRQELYPLEVPTRILTISFKLETHHLLLPEEGYPFLVDKINEDGTISNFGAVNLTLNIDNNGK